MRNIYQPNTLNPNFNIKHERFIFSPAYHGWMLAEFMRDVINGLKGERYELKGLNVDKLLEQVHCGDGFNQITHDLIRIQDAIAQNAKYAYSKEILGYGERQHEDGTSGEHYWVFKAGTSDERLLDILSYLGVDLDGCPVDSPYDCSGQLFTRSVYIDRHSYGVIVSQYWGIDC